MPMIRRAWYFLNNNANQVKIKPSKSIWLNNVLVKISNTIKNNIRSTDSFGRWGGDEFLIILPETNIEQAKNLINQLEKKLQNTNFELKENFKVTCSFGYAQYKEGDCLDSLIKRADESMYDIKAKYKKSKVSNI